MNATPPAWMKDPEVLGNWLATRTKYAGKTTPRLNRVSRVDAICWYLTCVGGLATRADIKAFATAFRTTGGEVLCASLLNLCYGGVGKDFSGTKWRGYNYGSVAPLYRPFKAQYAPTVDGVRRGAEVQNLLNSSLPS